MGRSPGGPLSVPPAESAAAWKASTVSRSAASNATCSLPRGLPLCLDPEDGPPVATEARGLAGGLEHDPEPERGQRRLVERPAAAVVGDRESHVVEHRVAPFLESRPRR